MGLEELVKSLVLKPMAIIALSASLFAQGTSPPRIRPIPLSYLVIEASEEVEPSVSVRNLSSGPINVTLKDSEDEKKFKISPGKDKEKEVCYGTVSISVENILGINTDEVTLIPYTNAELYVLDHELLGRRIRNFFVVEPKVPQLTFEDDTSKKRSLNVERDVLNLSWYRLKVFGVNSSSKETKSLATIEPGGSSRIKYVTYITNLFAQPFHKDDSPAGNPEYVRWGAGYGAPEISENGVIIFAETERIIDANLSCRSYFGSIGTTYKTVKLEVQNRSLFPLTLTFLVGFRSKQLVYSEFSWSEVLISEYSEIIGDITSPVMPDQDMKILLTEPGALEKFRFYNKGKDEISSFVEAEERSSKEIYDVGAQFVITYDLAPASLHNAIKQSLKDNRSEQARELAGYLLQHAAKEESDALRTVLESDKTTKSVLEEKAK